MAINIIEKTVVPQTDLNAGVIVYVPGYAIKGPEIAYCDASNFTDTFGEKPYVFEAEQKAAISKNSRFSGQQEKSWKFAKELTDAGLTVIYHRYKPANAKIPSSDEAFTISPTEESPKITFPKLGVRSKYFGKYYSGMYVEMTELLTNVILIEVYSAAPTAAKVYGSLLESHTVSLNPLDKNFIGFETFSNIEFYTGTADKINLGFGNIPFSAYFNLYPEGELTISPLEGKTGAILSLPPAAKADTDLSEFNVAQFERALAATDNTLFSILEDTNSYPSVSYVSTGGYFQDAAIAKRGITVARNIHANQFMVSLDKVLTDSESIKTFRKELSNLGLQTSLDYSFACIDVGADTYAPQGDRDIYPDYFGKLLALAGNIKSGIPAWMPIANNSNGSITSAVATTCPISKAMQAASISDTGVSVNPIVYKNGVGFVRMGNRTMFKNSGVLTADSFENCRTVVSTIERVCRQAADSLQIAKTNPTATFREFEAMVLPTANKMLVNGDGLNSIAFRKLPKTKPATIDIAIDLSLVEGIENFVVTITKSLSLGN